MRVVVSSSATMGLYEIEVWSGDENVARAGKGVTIAGISHRGRDVVIDRVVVVQPAAPLLSDRGLCCVSVLDAGRRIASARSYSSRSPPVEDRTQPN